jgi:hypothetical protein
MLSTVVYLLHGLNAYVQTCILLLIYVYFSGLVYEKYLTIEPDDMGESPQIQEDLDIDSEVTEDGELLAVYCIFSWSNVFFSSYYHRVLQSASNSFCLYRFSVPRGERKGCFA